MGKVVVTTKLINRIATKLKANVYKVPIGFKYFADGLLDSSLCFVGEESGGTSFSRLNVSVWTTYKDGFNPTLLSAEITAKFMQKVF